MVFSTRTNAYVQLATPPHLRGRVLSLYLAGFVGGSALGCPLIGWTTDVLGPRAGLAVSGGACLLAAGAALLTRTARNSPPPAHRAEQAGSAHGSGRTGAAG